jgi:hypothetical protein
LGVIDWQTLVGTRSSKAQHRRSVTENVITISSRTTRPLPLQLVVNNVIILLNLNAANR